MKARRTRRTVHRGSCCEESHWPLFHRSLRTPVPYLPVLRASPRAKRKASLQMSPPASRVEWCASSHCSPSSDFRSAGARAHPGDSRSFRPCVPTLTDQSPCWADLARGVIGVCRRRTVQREKSHEIERKNLGIRPTAVGRQVPLLHRLPQRPHISSASRFASVRSHRCKRAVHSSTTGGTRCDRRTQVRTVRCAYQ